MYKDIGVIKSAGSTLLRMWRVTTPQGKRPYQKHFHTQFEIMLVESGAAVFLTKNGKIQISKGDVLIFSSNEQHHIQEVFSENLVLLNIHFEPRYLWGNSTDSMSDENTNFCFSHSENFTNKIPHSAAEILMSFAKNIEAEFKRKAPEYKLLIKTYLNQLLVTLIRDFDYLSTTSPINTTNIYSIRQAVTYIDEHLSENIKLRDIASNAGLSATYFSALFKRLCSITLWDYIISKRIEKAIHLIVDKKNTLTILQIALACGFNNTANFNKAFKKQTGMTPSEYRICGEICGH